MVSKRKRDSPPAKLKSKKQRKKISKSGGIIPIENKYEALPSSENESDSSLKFDFKPNSREPEMVFVESDDDGDDIVIESDSDRSEDPEEPPSKKQKFVSNELAKNQDFIEFGFSSSEEEAREHDDYDDYSDDGVLSDDESGTVHMQTTAKSLYPWIKDHDHSKQKEIADWFTMEIKDFVNYISPSEAEIMTRNKVVNQLKQQISKFWPGTEVHVFGSCATDLYLPGSDIDMVVISETGDYEHRSRLYQLSSFLRNKKLAKNIEVIAKAKVPIIKFVDPTSNIHIDISFERTNGIDAAKKIRRWLSTTPGLRELVLIVKQFLRSRKLNNVHVGGLGGYSTIILCYHFLKLHPRLSTKNMAVLDNLGSLLIEFFELYGRNFSYDNLIIAIDTETDLPKYLLKRKHPVLNTSRNPFSIIIQDPSDPANNITRSSYNLRDLKKAFGGAYQLLVDKCYELNGASYKARIGQLILGDIIKYRGKERDFNDDRHKVTNDALINHENEDENDGESDGADGNNKYYFSDMTVESEEDTTFAQDAKPEDPNKKKVADFMSINPPSDDEEPDTKEKEEEDTETQESDKQKINLDKDTKRDYWRQKGLGL
ncbi:uncharacterized protein AC631_04129 [Debaryomyces fabryi]|uniref:polynucleotide adenylyltransferase n=1 Tax=Debaryomyces fabryi TaxID=58627 RepID=A0A0V1PVA8_9ASCO|nr:uncharacterized protein AC631_04129 [Debaryomyces fabryi]KSA00128.1 hypothetical protein AC631_04129 [Debaryomyces fabryi]CUM57012.1 unnamed protein product [Debaryomyces fabryi]